MGASRADLWALLTTRRAEWWPEATFAGKVGARVEETWMEGDDEHRAEGVVVKVREERALLFDWWTPENPQSLRVEIVIEDAGRVRRIAVTEEGFGHDERGLRLRTRREEVWRRRLTELSRIAEGRTSAVRLGE